MTSRLRILITGASGLIGSALSAHLRGAGHTVTPLVRSRLQAGEEAVYWNPAMREIDVAALEGFEAIIHLAGENIAGSRWTDEHKRRIYNSRVQGTRLLCEALAGLNRPPRILLSTSAVGYYGDRGDQILTETEPSGSDFTARLVRDWEAAAESARAKGLRVVHPRFGVVLAPHGGALEQFLLPFRFGAGGPLAGGRQYLSWIALDDILGAVDYLLACDDLSGPVNVVAPQPVRQRDFARMLGRVLDRPSWLNVPRFALNLRLGKELADSVLASMRVVPARLSASGYHFRYPDLEPALRHLLLP